MPQTSRRSVRNRVPVFWQKIGQIEISPLTCKCGVGLVFGSFFLVVPGCGGTTSMLFYAQFHVSLKNSRSRIWGLWVR